MSSYLYERPGWPAFTLDQEVVAPQLAAVRHLQGRLLGRMEGLGFTLRSQASLDNLTEDVLKSSEIEGEYLDRHQVRSSIARKLGVDIGALAPIDRNVEGVVEMMIDATQHFGETLTKERLFGWHAALFPTGYSGIHNITVGDWRTDVDGPMQVVSGPPGRRRVHYQAPAANNVAPEMIAFLDWFNAPSTMDPVVKAGIAHLWFVTIHPFDDGNGRIARALTDLMLARSEKSAERFYSMSAQIRVEREDYYRLLEATQKGDLNITPWMTWFLACLNRACEGAETQLASVLEKAQFWRRRRQVVLNERQRLMLNKLLDGFEGKLTSSTWAKIAKCSPDTALRDIDDLVAKGVLRRDAAGGRSTSYSLVEPNETSD